MSGHPSRGLPYWPSEEQAGKPLHPAVLHEPKTCSRCGKAFLFWHQDGGNWRLHHYADVGGGPRFILHRCGFNSAGEPIASAQWDGNPKGEDPQGLRAKHDSPVPEGNAP